MRAINIHALAIISISIVNIWLAVQNIRWLIYVNPVRTHLPVGNLHSSFDPILEAPAILIGIAMAYFLLYKIALNIWRIRYSTLFRDGLMARALSINSGLLLVVTAMGVAQWLYFFRYVPLDITVVSSLGAMAAIISLYLEKRLHSNGRYRSREFLPMAFLNSMAAIWGKGR
jgi:hypothetical protein